MEERRELQLLNYIELKVKILGMRAMLSGVVPLGF